MSNVIEPATPERIVKLPDLGFWTQARFERAKQLFSEGLSYTQVAVELGTTRNAVCGKMTRAGIFRGTERKRVLGTRTYSKRPGGYMRAQAIERRKEIWSGQLGTEITDLPADTPDNPVRLIKLHDDQCRWPCTGEGASVLFCGGEIVPHLSYCARHCRIAYQSPRR